jgi:hypothetical protein
MLVNENRLNLADQRAREYLKRQMESHFFGSGADQAAGYVPPRLSHERSRRLGDDGTPRSPRFDDIYRTAAGGLEQAQHVFLDGTGLPGPGPGWRSGAC